MNSPVKPVSFQHAVSAARQSRVDIRNTLTGATVSVRPEDVQRPAEPVDSNAPQPGRGGTASAAGALFTALIETVFGMDAPLAVSLDVLNNSVIKITIIDEQQGAQDEKALQL